MMFSVGEVPSVASALPSRAASLRPPRNGRIGLKPRHLERNDIPATPDCRGGVFATRRFPRPPPTPATIAAYPPRALQIPHKRCGTPKRSRRMVRAGTRCARHLPYQERNSKSRQLIEMHIIATRRATSLQTPGIPPGALGDGQATFGLPLQHRPYQERNSRSHQLIEMGFSARPI